MFFIADMKEIVLSSYGSEKMVSTTEKN